MIHNILFKYKWYIQATGEVLLMLSLYSLGSGWLCVRNPLCLCWWECPWVDGWMEGSVRFSLPCWGGFLSCPASKLLSVPLLVGIALESWAALCQNQGGMLLQVRYPLCLWECLWMDGSTGIYDENLLYLDLAWY